MPGSTQQLLDSAFEHHQAGRIAQAMALYRDVLNAEPNHCDALHLLGVAAHQSGQNELAVELINRAIAILPAAEYYGNLGLGLAGLEQYEQAIAAFSTAIQLKPDYAIARQNLIRVHLTLAELLSRKNELDRAIELYRRVLELAPNFPEAHNNLGNLLRDKGRLDDAVNAFEVAIRIKPDFAIAFNNLGNTLKDQGKLDRAIVAFRRAIELDPRTALIQSNLGKALLMGGKLDEAVSVCHSAIELQPDLAAAHDSLGNALKDRGELSEAIESYRKAIELDPTNAVFHSNLLFAIQFHPAYDRRRIYEEHVAWRKRHADELPRFTHASDHPSRLRIGYVSPDLREHPIGRLLLPLFDHHDHSRFEITCYADVAMPDVITDRLRTRSDRWRYVTGLSDERLAELIHSDRIDILVDLAVHSSHNRLLTFARKPAPVQVTWLGYPGTTGLNTIDFRLSDPYIDPPEVDESFYSERTIRLADTFWCYELVDQTPVNELPMATSGHTTFGCFNKFSKINDGVLELWARVLNAVPNSRLLLIAAQGSHRQRTLDKMQLMGVSPGCVEFIDRQQRGGYFEQFHRIDVALDTFPYSGHTTTIDSLWMGVPVVTLPGQTPASRGSLSILSNVGLSEYIASTSDEYVNAAKGLCGDVKSLKTLRRALRARLQASPLMDGPRFARSIEAAFIQMCRSASDNTTPAS